MRNLLLKIRDCLLILAALSVMATISVTVLSLLGWSSVDDLGGFGWSVAITTAALAAVMAANHYGERLWRWLRLDS